MFESTKIIGQLQYEKAKELFESRGEVVKGEVRLIYENINMTDRVVRLANGTKVTTCTAALGASFAAGTTDGEGAAFVSFVNQFRIFYQKLFHCSSSRELRLARKASSGTFCANC